MRVWERGVGVTRGVRDRCACAAAHGGQPLGTGRPHRYRVSMPGGDVVVYIWATPLLLAGPSPYTLQRWTMADSETHRGGFGTHGGESGAFIERAFREKIVLVGVTLAGGDPARTDVDLDELAQLIDTAGADEVGRLAQRRNAPDPSTYIGRGKVDEILLVCEQVDADTVVFDDELSPAQQFNLEKILGRTAIDRTAVILDIFAQNASSQEGQAQVELAQLRYRLPRLRRGRGFSQQAGGIGTRGPGETQLEVDRRRIQRRIHKLEAQLRSIAKTRTVQGRSRRRSAQSAVAIVGYTNAGKSRLLNRLTDSGVLVQNRLFATLDAATRRLELPGGGAGAAHRHRRIHPEAAPPAGGGVSIHPRRGGRGRPSAARGGRLRARPRRPHRRRAPGAERNRRRGGA